METKITRMEVILAAIDRVTKPLQQLQDQFLKTSQSVVKNVSAMASRTAKPMRTLQHNITKTTNALNAQQKALRNLTAQYNESARNKQLFMQQIHLKNYVDDTNKSLKKQQELFKELGKLNYQKNSGGNQNSSSSEKKSTSVSISFSFSFNQFNESLKPLFETIQIAFEWLFAGTLGIQSKFQDLNTKSVTLNQNLANTSKGMLLLTRCLEQLPKSGTGVGGGGGGGDGVKGIGDRLSGVMDSTAAGLVGASIKTSNRGAGAATAFVLVDAITNQNPSNLGNLMREAAIGSVASHYISKIPNKYVKYIVGGLIAAYYMADMKGNADNKQKPTPTPYYDPNYHSAMDEENITLFQGILEKLGTGSSLDPLDERTLSFSSPLHTITKLLDNIKDIEENIDNALTNNDPKSTNKVSENQKQLDQGTLWLIQQYSLSKELHKKLPEVTSSDRIRKDYFQSTTISEQEGALSKIFQSNINIAQEKMEFFSDIRDSEQFSKMPKEEQQEILKKIDKQRSIVKSNMEYLEALDAGTLDLEFMKSKPLVYGAEEKPKFSVNPYKEIKETREKIKTDSINATLGISRSPEFIKLEGDVKLYNEKVNGNKTPSHSNKENKNGKKDDAITIPTLTNHIQNNKITQNNSFFITSSPVEKETKKGIDFLSTNVIPVNSVNSPAYADSAR